MQPCVLLLTDLNVTHSPSTRPHFESHCFNNNGRQSGLEQKRIMKYMNSNARCYYIMAVNASEWAHARAHTCVCVCVCGFHIEEVPKQGWLYQPRFYMITLRPVYSIRAYSERCCVLFAASVDFRGNHSAQPFPSYNA